MRIDLRMIGLPGYVLDDEITEIFGKTGRPLNQRVDNFGYKCIYVEIPGISKNQRVHKIVAKACLPNPNKYPLVMHKDDNKLNNHPSNLQWGTSRQNNWRSNPKAVGYKPKLGKGQNKHAERKDKELIMEAITQGLSKAAICRQFGCGHNTVTRYIQEKALQERND